VENIDIVSSLSLNENNNASENATQETPQRGLFLTPSSIDGRVEDVTGMVVVAKTNQGKLGFLPTDELEGYIRPKGEALQDDISDPIILNARTGTIQIANLTLVPYDGDSIILSNSFIDVGSLIFITTVDYTDTLGTQSNITWFVNPPTLGQVEIFFFNNSPTRSFSGSFTFSFLVL